LALEFGLRRRCARCIVRIEKDMAGSEHRRWRDAGVAGQRAQPRGRPVQQHAAAVAGYAIGADAAAVRHACERYERLIDDPRAGLAVDVGDDAEAATVMLERRVVKTGVADRIGTLSVAVLHGTVSAQTAASGGSFARGGCQ
jgi:hypothetical protein